MVKESRQGGGKGGEEFWEEGGRGEARGRGGKRRGQGFKRQRQGVIRTGLAWEPQQCRPKRQGHRRPPNNSQQAHACATRYSTYQVPEVGFESTYANLKQIRKRKKAPVGINHGEIRKIRRKENCIEWWAKSLPHFCPTHLLELVPLSSRLPHDERHSPEDKVELLPRAGEVSHGEGLVSCLQALQQSGGLQGDRREGVLEK